MNVSKLAHFLQVPQAELETLLRRKPNPKMLPRLILFLIGALASPVSLTGVLLGYSYAYHRLLLPKKQLPEMWFLPKSVKLTMAVCGIIIWLICFLLAVGIVAAFEVLGIKGAFLFQYIAVNIALCAIVYGIYRYWRNGYREVLSKAGKYGSASEATLAQLMKFLNIPGLYIGGGYAYPSKGHCLICAGTRAGKGTNIIIPNLMGMGRMSGSAVIIDIKGENCAVTADYQRSRGQKVVVINPFQILPAQLGLSDYFNPLDLLSDASSLNLFEDSVLLAELMVENDLSAKDKFFTDNARAIISGLIMHLVTSQPKEKRTLTTLYKWIRLGKKKWQELVISMSVNSTPVNGATIQGVADTIIKLAEAGDKTWGSIVATMIQHTEFLGSPALQKTLVSGFDPKTLSNGYTSVFVVIPPDKLDTQASFLRLMVTSLMRAVVRNPNKRVVFFVDELPALKFLPEISTCLSVYAGYNISLVSIVQNLAQLKNLYKDNWENFIGNSAVKLFFNVKDAFTTEYVSKLCGQTSHVEVKRSFWGIKSASSTPRPLVTPDEVYRGSEDYIFSFIDQLPYTSYLKLPYYRMKSLHPNGRPLYQPNPYMTAEEQDMDAFTPVPGKGVTITHNRIA